MSEEINNEQIDRVVVSVVKQNETRNEGHDRTAVEERSREVSLRKYRYVELSEEGSKM